jgi:hypothetical protein
MGMGRIKLDLIYMNRFLLFLLLPFCAFAQSKPWTGNATNAWLTQSPNGVKISQSGTNTRVVLNGQSSTGKLIFDSSIGSPSTNDKVVTRASGGSVHVSTYSIADLLASAGANQTTINVTADNQVINPTGWDVIRLHSDDLDPTARTIKLSAPVSIGQKVSLMAVGTDGLVELPNGSSVDGGSGLVYLGAYDWSSTHVNEMLNLTSDGTNWVARSRQVFPPVIFSSGGQTNWGILVLDPGTGVARNTGVTIADIINGGGPGGTNQNFANANLTADADRTHDWDGHSFQLFNFSTANFVTASGQTQLSLDPGGSSFTAFDDSAYLQIGVGALGELRIFTPNVQAFTAIVGQVLTLQNLGSGGVEYQTIYFKGTASDTGGGAFVAATASIIPAYSDIAQPPDGSIVYLKLDVPTSANSTLQLGDSSPPLPIVRPDGTATQTNDIRANLYCTLILSGSDTNAVWTMQFKP